MKHDDRRFAPAAARNRDVILGVLGPLLPPRASVLEIASGSGEHICHFAAAHPELTFQPSDPDPDSRSSIDAWARHLGLGNVAPAIALDATQAFTLPVPKVDVIICINMIHISPWAATEGLMAGAGRLLPSGGLLYLYGPYLEADVETAPSNLAFDQSLKDRNPAWGLRHLDDVVALAARHGLTLAERIAMPANNLSLIFRKA